MKSWRMQRARDLLADLAGLRAHSGDEFKALAAAAASSPAGLLCLGDEAGIQ